MKRLVKIGFWIVITISFFVVWGFSMAEQNNKICTSLKIQIDMNGRNTFINNQDVELSLRQENLHPVGKRLGDIDLLILEDKIDRIAEVKKAAVSKNLDGSISIRIKQRNPMVRIINAGGRQYYLDEDGYQMPLSDNYTARVPVVTGYINDPVTEYSAEEIVKDETLAKTVKSDEVYTMVKYINKDKFWKAQIQQINFNYNSDIELIPTLGSHLIVFGNLENMEKKFNKLKLFYTEGLNHLDWNIYDTINIKYKNQIICTKR